MADEQLDARPAAAPALAPLDRVSPTLGESLRQCFLRVAFALDKRFDPMRKPSTATALGIVSHELAEAASRGRFRGVDLETAMRLFDDEWDTAIGRERSKLEEAWPLAPIPPSQRWRGYELVRTRLRRMLLRGVETEDYRPLEAEKRQIETWLEDAPSRLFGRADRVDVFSDGSVEIVDLKSGWALPDEMKPEHRRQLLAYSFLWHAQHGVWPKTAAIQRLDGSRLTVDVDPEAAMLVARELLAKLEEYNAAIATDPSPDALASPSAESCGFCDYRAACSPFFGALTHEWAWYRRHALGRVARVTEAGGSAVIELEAENSNLPEGVPSVRLLGFPSALAPPIGTKLAITDATPARAAGDARVAWDTRAIRWH